MVNIPHSSQMPEPGPLLVEFVAKDHETFPDPAVRLTAATLKAALTDTLTALRLDLEDAGARAGLDPREAVRNVARAEANFRHATVTRSPVTPGEHGNATQGSVTRFPTPGVGNGEHAPEALYADLAALLDGDLPDAPEPEVLSCNDGVSLFYAGQVNLVFGDPESGKTWLCLAAVAEALRERGKAAVVDLDHNGPGATVTRLLALGAPEDALRDPSRFRYAEPEDGHHLLAVVADLARWKPRAVVLDSLGEVLPLFGASSNSPDDFTRVHGLVLKPLAMSGASVLVIDHLAKGSESRAMGSTGTAAKKRAVGGVSLRVSVAEQFTPGKGGAAHVTIAKDRHGGLRANRPTGDKEPLAGTFRLYGDGHGKRYDVLAPADGERNPGEAADPADVARVAALDPPPTSVRDVRERLQIRSERAAAALRTWREQQRYPFPTPLPGNGEHVLVNVEKPADPERSPFPDTRVGNGEQRVPVFPTPLPGNGEHATPAVRPTPPEGTSCPDCGELLTDPGATTRCRPNHGSTP